MCGGEGEGEGKVVEQQIGALGNPCSSFSSSSLLLCIQRGFDKNFTLGSAIQNGNEYMSDRLKTAMFKLYNVVLESMSTVAIFYFRRLIN